MKRSAHSDFLENIMVSKRGLIKIASSKLPNGLKEDSCENIIDDIKKVLRAFDKSPDISKATIEIYKKRANLDFDKKQVTQDFFKELVDQRSKFQQMSILTAMSFRRTGIFKVAGRDVYEDLETGDFWKISEDKKHVVRLFKEDEQGVSDKRAGKKQRYTVMGEHPGDGGVVVAESFEDAAAEFFSQDGDYTKKEILDEIKKRPGKKISDTEMHFGDYEIKLLTDIEAKKMEVDLGPGVVMNIEPTKDDMGFEIEISGSFRSGDSLEDTVRQIKNFWKKLDIDA